MSSVSSNVRRCALSQATSCPRSDGAKARKGRTGDTLTLRAEKFVLAVALVVGACKPSAEDLAKQAAQAEAADKQRAHAAVLERQVKQKHADEETGRAADEEAKREHDTCPVAAELMIAKMRSCGLNMDGISAASLCVNQRSRVLSVVASRPCQEIEAALFAK